MKTYKLTKQEYEDVLKASQPVMYIIANGVGPTSPRVAVMHVWNRIAKRVGCDVHSIAPGNTDLEFTAKPLAT